MHSYTRQNIQIFIVPTSKESEEYLRLVCFYAVIFRPR